MATRWAQYEKWQQSEKNYFIFSSHIHEGVSVLVDGRARHNLSKIALTETEVDTLHMMHIYNYYNLNTCIIDQLWFMKGMNIND